MLQFQELPEASLEFSEKKGLDLNFIKYIVLGIAILIIVFLIINFIFLSNKEIEVKVEDFEGNPLIASIEVFSENNDLILKEQGKDFYSINLRTGKYSIKAKAQNFKSKIESIEVSENTTIELKLEKDIPVSILSLNFPEKLYPKQKANAFIVIQNNSSEEQQLELVSSNLETATITASSVVLKPNETKQLNLTIEVKNVSNIPKEGLKVSGFIRVKFTEIKTEFSFTLLRLPSISLDKKIDFSSIDLSIEKNYEKTITIENKSNVRIESLKLSLEITEAVKNNIEDVINWISFSENNQRTLEIQLNEKEKKEIKIKLQVPLNAKKELIKGALIVEADFLSEPIKSDISIEIKEEAIALLSVEFKPTNEALFLFDENKQVFPEKNDFFLLISNNGTVSFSNILIALVNQEECTKDFIEINSSTLIQELKKSEEKKILFSLKMPSNAENNKEVNCKFAVIYRNPLTSERKREEFTLKLIAVKQSIVS